MMQLKPDLIVRRVEQKDATALGALFNPWIERAPFGKAMNRETVLAEVLRNHPHTVFPARFQQNQCLGAWRAGQLVGAIDVAVGFDNESVDLPDYLPLGLLRFMVLPERDELVTDVAELLLDAAEAFWRKQGIGHVKAFHFGTGYPSLQAGVGLLPGDWSDIVRVLTGYGYAFADRCYGMHRLLNEPVEEVSPVANVGLVLGESHTDRLYTLYHRRTDRIASSRLVRAETVENGEEQVIGLLAALFVEPLWRQHNFGRWLVSRMINDGRLLGYRQIVAFLSTSQGAAMNLLTQLGFEEIHYRGYTFEKQLAR